RGTGPVSQDDRRPGSKTWKERIEMNTLLWWLGQNTITVALMIPLVLLASRLFRNRPAVQHVLWLVVLLKFVSPSIVAWPWTVQQMSEPFWPAVAASANPIGPADDSNAITQPLLVAPDALALKVQDAGELNAVEGGARPAEGG